MYAATKCAAKSKIPLHAVPRPHRHVEYTRKFTCNRHPYRCAAAVACFLRAVLLNNCITAEQELLCRQRHTPDDVRCCLAPVAAAVPQLRGFVDALHGAPHCVEAEGPLPVGVLQEMSLCLSNTSVEALGRVVLGEEIATPEEHPLLKSLWFPTLREGYGAALIEERKAHVVRKRNGVLEARHEAGLHSRRLVAALLKEADRSATDEGLRPREQEHLAAVCQEWMRLIDVYTLPFPDRSHLHELENLPQEIALGEVLAHAVAGLSGVCGEHRGAREVGKDPPRVECVVDVGGGNGFLTAALAERLDCDGLIVDPFFPSHSIDCLPSPWPNTTARERSTRPRRRTVSRVTAYLQDVDWRADIGSDPAHTVVVAKHLCGSGIDECLTTLDGQGVRPRVLVLAPCCFPKIKLERYCDPAFLARCLGIETQEGFDRIGSLTDWNMSCAQFAKEAVIEQMTQQRGRIASQEPAGARELSFPYKRVGSFRSVASILPCMHALSQLIESLINHGRVLWLRQRGYDARVVQYVPNQVTPKCKCIVAVRP